MTTQVDTATGQWDTTGATGEVNAPADTMSMPADTGMAAPTTPTDTTVGQYPAPSDTAPMTTQPTTPDTSSYVPDTGAARVPDTSAVNPSDPSAGRGYHVADPAVRLVLDLRTKGPGAIRGFSFSDVGG